jgi:hypothetical protein
MVTDRRSHFCASDGAVQSLKALSLKNLEMDENHCRVLGAIRGQISRSYCTTVNLRVLEQVLWQRSLDAIGPTNLFVKWTIRSRG